MEDSENYWIPSDDSSNCSLTDSDKIDSEIEAELYSEIHYASNLTYFDSENLTEKSPELSVNTPVKEENICTSSSSSEHLFPNNFSNAKRKSSEMDAGYKKSDEKLSPAKKLKSMAVCQSVNSNSNNLENINGSLQFKKNNLQNENKIISYSEKKSNNKNKTSMLDSSDSDNDIWIEPNSDDKSDLKINLLKNSDVIFLSSSDSENESDVSSPFMGRNSIFKNLSMPNIKNDGDSKDLWHINYEDLHSLKRQYYRYHGSICSNCNKKGHTYRTCPLSKVIKCFFCGGNHMGFRCLKRMCSNCHVAGHDRSNCRREVYNGFCNLCDMKGHAKENCPDLWRRYHLSTNLKELTKGKQTLQNTTLYCWNCGREGHFGAVCPLSHLSRNTFNTWPCVISYTDPKFLLKSRLLHSKKISSLNAEKRNNNFNNIVNASSEKVSHELYHSKANERRKRARRKKKIHNQNLSKEQGIVKEKDFPRTPKNENPVNCSIESEEEMLLQFSVKKQLTKLKKHWYKQVSKSGLQSQEIKDSRFVSKVLNEKSPVKFECKVPALIMKEVKKRFNKWRKRQISALNRSQKFERGRKLIQSRFTINKFV